MPLRIFADECVHKSIVTQLRDEGYHVDYISEHHPGWSDHEIIKYAEKESALLITEDSDFGEWVFVHGYNNVGIIFLRYNKSELTQISHSVKIVLEKYQEALYRKFVVITTKKIRIRDLI